MTNYNDLRAALKDCIETENNTPRIRRKAFEDNLPENYTMADVKNLDRYSALFRAAGASAVSDAALDMLVENTGVDYIDTEVEFGSQSTLRNRVHRNLRLGKGDKARDQFGHSTPVINNGHEPELLEAIEAIARRGTELFGNK